MNTLLSFVKLTMILGVSQLFCQDLNKNFNCESISQVKWLYLRGFMSVPLVDQIEIIENYMGKRWKLNIFLMKNKVLNEEQLLIWPFRCFKNITLFFFTELILFFLDLHLRKSTIQSRKDVNGNIVYLNLNLEKIF